MARGILTTNEFGYEDLIRYEDEAGLPIQNAHGFGQSRSKYDRFGNMVSRRFFDEHGKDMLFNGYNSYRFKWSGDGRRLESFSMFDKDSNLATHSRKGYAQLVMKYDEQGNRTQITYLDATGHVVNRKDNGIATIHRRHDAGNRLVRTESRDRTGKLIRSD